MNDLLKVREHNENHNIFIFGLINTFFYKNHRGERALRTVIPMTLRWGRTEYYPEDQWLLDAYDMDKNDFRTFALSNIDPR